MEMARIIEQLIRRHGYNIKSFAAKCGMPYTTLYGIIKNGVGKASVNNIVLICKNLGITVEQLEDMVGNEYNDESSVLDGVYFSFAKDAKDSGINPIDKSVTNPRVHVLQRAADNGLSDDELDDILKYAEYRYPDKFKKDELNEEDNI